jgi:hypothetical protein
MTSESMAFLFPRTSILEVIPPPTLITNRYLVLRYWVRVRVRVRVRVIRVRVTHGRTQHTPIEAEYSPAGRLLVF